MVAANFAAICVIATSNHSQVRKKGDTFSWPTNQRRRWHTTPVLLPGKPHGQRSLVGCSPWDREESDSTERLHFHFSLFTFKYWRRKWQPTPAFLLGESQGQGSLLGCRLWGRTELDTTEATWQQPHPFEIAKKEECNTVTALILIT